MIKVTRRNKDEKNIIYINQNLIASMERLGGHYSSTHVIMNSTGTYFYIDESPEEVMKMISEEE